ncbi:MAG: TadE/TadG family type IV pilus assembly protein, partial [Anaerolineales bacterium]
PLFLLFFVGIVEFGLFFWTAHVVQNGGREGARQAVVLSNLVENDPRVIDRVDLVLPVSGLITDLSITNTVPDCDGDGQITVTVTGTYNFIFL